MNARAERFPLMDSMRAIAALSVLAAHAALFAGLWTSGSFLQPYVSQLGAGISVFFLISAFLLYRPFVVARVNGERLPSTGAYAWRRFLRIVPAYWVALTVLTLCLTMGSVVKPIWHAVVLYGFGQIYTVETTGLGIPQAGTLCVEMTFYAFIPLWAFAMRRRGLRTELAALAGLVLFSTAWKLAAIDQVGAFTVGGGPWRTALPGFIDQFAVGMALAIASVHGLPARAARAVARAWPWWLAGAVAYVLVADVVGQPPLDAGRGGGGLYMLRHWLVTLFAATLLVPAMFASDRGGAIRRVLGWRPLLYVGLVSYGVYLWHYAVVQQTANGISGWLTNTLGFGPTARFLVLFATGLAGAIAIASVSYYLVERPFLSLKGRVRAGPDRAEPSEAIAEPAPATPATVK
jgi:peptidoglycan/LPS O-acetylase OafA/YrhL